MQKKVSANSEDDREMQRKISRTSRLIRGALGAKHTLKWRYAGPPRVEIEAYLCAPTAIVTFPKLPMCAIGMLVEGRKVRNLRNLENGKNSGDEALVTLPNRCVLLPQGVATHWRPAVGSVTLAGVYLSGPGQSAIEQMTVGATRPKQIRDSVLVAIIRQLLAIAKEGDQNLPTNYEAHLVNALTAQLQWLATQKQDIDRGRSTTTDHAIGTALRLIEEHLDESITIEWLCNAVRLSPALFRKRFRELTGKPVHQYIIAARVDRARELIEETSLPLAVVAMHSGFSSQSHMTSIFKNVTGATPHEQRRSKAGIGRG